MSRDFLLCFFFFAVAVADCREFELREFLQLEERSEEELEEQKSLRVLVLMSMSAMEVVSVGTAVLEFASEADPAGPGAQGGVVDGLDAEGQVYCLIGGGKRKQFYTRQRQ